MKKVGEEINKAEETEEEKKNTTKAAEDTEDKTTKASEKTDDSDKTTKASETDDKDKTEKAVSRAEFAELGKQVAEGFNAITAALGKMAKAMDTDAKDQRQPDKKKEDVNNEGKTVDKASGGEAKDQEQPSKDKKDPEEGKGVGKAAANGTDTEGEREKARKAGDKDDTYDLETVERAVKRIKAVTKGMDESEEDKTTKASETDTERTEKSVKVSSIDAFAVTVADAIERMEKSLKEGGFQTEHIAKAVINQIRSNPEYQKDIAGMMSEPGAKRSVIGGTPFVKTKDGRMFQLTLSEAGAAKRTEKSADAPKDFKSMWGSSYSSSPSRE